MTVTDPKAAPDRDSRFCGGPKRQGEGTCTRPAGWGTPHPGIGRCKLHGGSTKSHVEAARQELARRELAKVWRVDVDPVMDPAAEMRRLAGQMRHALDELGSRLEGDGEPCDVCGRGDLALDSPPAVAWLRQQRELRQLLEAMERLGLMDRQVQVSESQGQILASVIRAVLLQLSLTDEQTVKANEVVPAELRRASGGDVVGEVVGGGAA